MSFEDLKSLLDIDVYGIVTMDFAEAWQRIREVLYDPSSDPKVAWLVFGILSMFVVIVLLAGIVYILSSREGTAADGYYDEDGNLVTVLEDGEVAPLVSVEPVAASAPVVASPRSALLSAVFGILTVAIVWAALAFGTGSNEACLGCHTSTPHQVGAVAGAVKPANSHESLSCIDCHESGGSSRWTLSPIGRTGHIVAGFKLTPMGDDYGVVTTRGCLRCHSRVAEGTVENAAKGIKVSHVEPLAAGQKCVDCHPLEAGVVKSGPDGHTRCVRCHNGVKAPSACESCHVADISLASSAPRSNDATAGRQLIGTPDCGGCHDVAKSCDPCHGIRLPHTDDFIRGGHARDAVLNYWNGDGKACVKCHTEDRRPCGTCHTAGKFWSHGKQWRTLHQAADPVNNNCQGCHNGTQGTLPNRNFCIDNCHRDKESWRRAE